jgi:hypothetical protein
MQTGPNFVDFGTLPDIQMECAKRRIFSNAGGGWKRGFWHNREGGYRLPGSRLWARNDFLFPPRAFDESQGLTEDNLS